MVTGPWIENIRAVISALSTHTNKQPCFQREHITGKGEKYIFLNTSKFWKQTSHHTQTFSCHCRCPCAKDCCQWTVFNRQKISSRSLTQEELTTTSTAKVFDIWQLQIYSIQYCYCYFNPLHHYTFISWDNIVICTLELELLVTLQI